MKLGEIAVKWGLIGNGDLDRCLQYQKHLTSSQAPLKLGQILVKLDLISARQLVALLDVQRKIRNTDAPGSESSEEGEESQLKGRAGAAAAP